MNNNIENKDNVFPEDEINNTPDETTVTDTSETTEAYSPDFILVTDDNAEKVTAEKSVEDILTEKLSEYEETKPEELRENMKEEIQPEIAEKMPADESPEEEKVQTIPHRSSKPEGYDYRFATPEKKVREKKQRNSSGIILVAVCLIVSLIGSYIGGYYGMQKAMKANGGTVLYQTVQRTDENGKDILTLTVESAAELVKSSVVEIRTETVVQSSGFFVQEYITEGAGSGVIISDDGYIVTNNHVIDGASTIRVRTVDGTEYTAKLIGTDAKTDLAVVKVEAAGLNPAVFGSSSTLKVGQGVVAVGNPLGELGGTVTDGIISALERELTIESQKMTLLQTNAAVNPGNSGGGLFNLRGELVGIVNAKSGGSGIEGLGFAIPVDDAKEVIEELIDIGYVSGRAFMGVTLIDIQDYMTAASYRVNKYGVYILEIQDNSAADKAGLKPGDYVVALDDTEIEDSAQFVDIVGSKSVGDKIMLYIERGGESMSIEVTLGEYVPSAR
ncbi:MAG: trypsin-like serine protease [Anaerofustis stercorihominis]|nr:trypsin-like serine protease [Anaerofustis stercorihominis]